VTRPILLLALALLLAVPLSLLAGRVWIDPLDPVLPAAPAILFELRLPRAALALVVGAGLGGAGAAMQGYLRNPLADPGLFGIAPGAGIQRSMNRTLCSVMVTASAAFFSLPDIMWSSMKMSCARLVKLKGSSSSRERNHATVAGIDSW